MPGLLDEALAIRDAHTRRETAQTIIQGIEAAALAVYAQGNNKSAADLLSQVAKSIRRVYNV